MRKAYLILILVFVMAVAVPMMSFAQEHGPVPGTMRSTQLVYTGPGSNAGVVEFVAPGRGLFAQGRSADGSWVQIVLDGQVEGWVPARSVRPSEGNLSDLPIKGGLLDVGNGAYRAANPSIRQAEAEMLKIQRPLREVQARFNRLQGFQGTNCDPITAPRPPAISGGMIGAVPQLEQVKTELTFVAEQTALAIEVLEQACSGGDNIGGSVYDRLMQHVYAAQNAYNNVRFFINEITGLQFVE